MLTVFVHPDLASSVPADMKRIIWTDLPLLAELPPGPCYLADARCFPKTLPLLNSPRVLNRRRLGTLMGFPAFFTFGSGLRTPVVLRSEHPGGCRQSPLLTSEQEVRDELVDWTLRSVPFDGIRMVDVVEDPFAPFINGSFLKVGAELIPGRRFRLADWYADAEPLEDELPEDAPEWAAQIPLDVAQIIYLEQNGQATPWRIDDSLNALLGYLAERPATRVALQTLIDAMERDGGDNSEK
jgi:hypothetical protein